MQVPVDLAVRNLPEHLSARADWRPDFLGSASRATWLRGRCLAAILAGLIVLAVAIMAAAGIAREQARLLAEARMQDIAQSAGLRVKQSIGQHLQALQSLADVLSAMNALPDRAALGPPLIALREHFPAFSWVAVASPREHVCGAAAAEGEAGVPVPGQSVGQEAWYQAGRLRPAVVAGEPAPAGRGAPVPLYISVPLRGARGELAGVIVARLAGNWAAGLRDHPAADQQLTVWLRDADGAASPLSATARAPAAGRMTFDADATPASWVSDGRWIASLALQRAAVHAGVTQVAAMILAAGAVGALVSAALLGLVLGRVMAPATPVQMEALRQAATRDPMTGLLNRRGLAEAALRLPPGQGAVLLADIDHFKAVNDRHGHAAGDCVICAVAGALGRAVGRAGDVARYGGEEFLILLPGDGGCLDELAERLRADIAGLRVGHGGVEIAVTASIGLARARPGESLAALVERADAALYRAKQAGRDRIDAAA